MWGVGVAVCGTDLDFLETVIFYFQTNRERKKEKKKFGRKKGFLSFYSVCMFVYMCVCVCVFVCLLALYRRHRLT